MTRLIEGTGSKLPEDDLKWYRALINDTGHVNGTLAMMAQWDLGPLLQGLPEHPSHTLLITGALDKAVPPGTSTDVAQKMPKAEAVQLPGLGHLAHEEDAESVLAPIIAFLRRNSV